MNASQQYEQLPEPIDIEELARRNQITVAEAKRLLRIAEWRGKAFSRIDSTGRLQWYWYKEVKQREE